MVSSVNRSITVQPFNGLDNTTEDTVKTIADTLLGNSTISITPILFEFFKYGISEYYFNLRFGDFRHIMNCGTNAIFNVLFPESEQAAISTLGKNLQQISEAIQVLYSVSELHKQ